MSRLSLSTAAAPTLDVQGEHDRLGLSLVIRLTARRRSVRTVHNGAQHERAQPWSVQSCDVACALRVIVEPCYALIGSNESRDMLIAHEGGVFRYPQKIYTIVEKKKNKE